MKRVVDKSQVSHLWAHQSQDNARNGSNVSFDGPDFYSYSTVIGHLDVEHNVAFINTHSFSSTTAGHQSLARQACRNVFDVFCSDWTINGSGYYGSRGARFPGAETAIKAKITELQELLPKIARARSNAAGLLSEYRAGRLQVLEVAALYNVTVTDLPAPGEDLDLQVRLAGEKYKEQRKITLASEKARKAERQAKDLDDLNKWLSGESHRYPSSYRNNGTGSQLTIRKDTVITSQGAEAPLDHVIKALRFYDSRRYGHATPKTQYTPYHTNGHKIALGHFVLDSIDEAGNVKAGCHTFTAQEIARFRKQWNL